MEEDIQDQYVAPLQVPVPPHTSDILRCQGLYGPFFLTEINFQRLPFLGCKDSLDS